MVDFEIQRRQAKSGIPYVGSRTYPRIAKAVARDASIQGADDDAMEEVKFIDADKVLQALQEASKRDYEYVHYDKYRYKTMLNAIDAINAAAGVENAPSPDLRRKSASNAGEPLFTPKDQLTAASRVASPNRRGSLYPAAEEGREADNNYRSLDQIWREADAPDVHPLHNYEIGGGEV